MKSKLAIDTSGFLTAVAFQCLNGEVFEEQVGDQEAAASSERLPDLIRLVLERSKTASNLDCVIVAEGPGSFTGLKVGLAFAKGICWSKRIPLIGICSLKTQALELLESGRKVVSMHEAGKDQIFVGVFELDCEQNIKTILEPTLVLHGEFKNLIKQISRNEEELSFVGQLRKADFLANQLKQPCHLGRSLIKLSEFSGISVTAEGEDFISKLAAFSPNYLRVVNAKKISERK